MWNWKNQGSDEKFYNMSQNWGNPTTNIFNQLVRYLITIGLMCRLICLYLLPAQVKIQQNIGILLYRIKNLDTDSSLRQNNV